MIYGHEVYWDEDEGGHEGRQSQGPLRGKQPKLSPKQEAHLVGLYRAGEHTGQPLIRLWLDPARSWHTQGIPHRSF